MDLEQRKSKAATKAVSPKGKETSQERQLKSNARKELLKMQQKAKMRKIREEKEQKRQFELKKKQNLDALNSKLRKKAENFKAKMIVNQQIAKQSNGPTSTQSPSLQDEPRTSNQAHNYLKKRSSL